MGTAQIKAMGFSIRSSTVRYTEWRKWVVTEGVNAPDRADWSAAGLFATELYRESIPIPYSFDDSENVNFAKNATYAPVLATLKAALAKQYNVASPPQPPPPPPPHRLR